MSINIRTSLSLSQRTATVLRLLTPALEARKTDLAQVSVGSIKTSTRHPVVAVLMQQMAEENTQSDKDGIPKLWGATVQIARNTWGDDAVNAALIQLGEKDA